MMNNAKGKIKSNWKPIVWGLIPFIIIVIIFSLPIKTVPIQVTENYWDTEMKDESYTVPESYTVTEPYTDTATKTDTVYNAYINSGNWSYTFDVKKPDSKVIVNLSGYSYYPQYFILPGDTGDSGVRFFPWQYSWGGGSTKAIIQVTYSEDVTKYRTVTKYRDVVKTHQVPTQVLKEKKVTKYAKMSIWAYLFFNQPQ